MLAVEPSDTRLTLTLSSVDVTLAISGANGVTVTPVETRSI